jgi:hypothetical protein
VNYVDNKYSNWYFAIINKRKSNPITKGYTESHHIEPKSLGGQDKKENLVELSAKTFKVRNTSLKKFCNDFCKNKHKRNLKKFINITKEGETKKIQFTNFNAYKKCGWIKI